MRWQLRQFFIQRNINMVFNIAVINKHSNSCYENALQNFSTKPKEIIPVKMAYIAQEGKQGGGAPIVIVHGLFGSKTNWGSLGKAINEQTQKTVYMVDVRNHGDSPHSNDHSYFHIVEDIKLFLSDHQIKKVALIGHSMGGRAVMVFALENQRTVESLTVVDISPIIESDAGRNNLNYMFDKMKSVDLKTGSNLSEVRKNAESELTELIGSKAVAKFLSLSIAEKEKGIFVWKLNLDALHRAYNEHIIYFPNLKAKFEGPTHFIFGEETNFVNFDTVHKIKKFFPNFSFVKVPDAGHWVHSEKPKEFLEIACNFINKSKS